MKKHTDPCVHNQTKLRQLAEEQLKKMKNDNISFALEMDFVKQIHELQIHQLELQIQNEELIQSKERAELAEKKYRELYDSAPSGYLTLSREGNIMKLNDSASRMLHKEQSKLINNRFALFLSQETKGIFSWLIERVHQNSLHDSCEAVLEISGFAPVCINIDAVASKDNQFYLLTIVDITKSKEADKALYQLKVANETIRFKQNFLANISHEMRTPLTGILGMIDILEQTSLTKAQQDYVNTLKHSGENLREIINQVLDYSKIEAGKIKTTPSMFSLSTLLAEMEIMQNGRVKPDVQFRIIADPEIPALVYADNGRIRQVVNNLVSNALKFTTTGSVIVSSQLMSSLPFSNQLLIKITVTDTGIGIPEEMRDKLFIPFSQIYDKDTREYEGTGLGLSICKELVMLLGGKLGVESESHKGSTFWFEFPVQITDAAVKTENPLVSPLNILYAEDKEINQKVVKLLLQSMGHKVTLANDGQQAINSYKPGAFDLILMDIQMPEMDGITATRKLKETFSNLPPIIGLSANAFEGDREKYMAQGLDEYLTKPFNKKDFNDLITKFINKQSSAE
jgi:PAS domain S-box-containing protein